MKLTTIKAICARWDTPYFVLSLDNSGVMLRKTMPGTCSPVQMNDPLIYCGQVRYTHPFGRSFIYSKIEGTNEGDAAFHCQSYQSHKAFNFEEGFGHFIEDHPALFKTVERRECLFLGGMNLEMTPNGPSYTLPGAANFGHFIFEYLNRLVIFDALDLLHLPMVVYDCLPKRYLEWLKLLGVKEFIFIPPHGGPAFSRLWVTSAPHYRGTDGVFRFWGEGLSRLRQMLVKAADMGDVACNRRRVYLGRTTATHRRVKNEAEVFIELGKLGFEFPDMENKTPSQQLHTMEDAAVIVAIAGANTILTHFAPTHAAIITLYPKDMGHGPWGGLGAAMFLRQFHERIECEAVDVPGLHRANAAGVNELSDIIVDVPALILKVKLAIKLTDGAIDDALRL